MQRRGGNSSQVSNKPSPTDALPHKPDAKRKKRRKTTTNKATSICVSIALLLSLATVFMIAFKNILLLPSLFASKNSNPFLLRRQQQLPSPLLSDHVIEMCTNALWHTLETTTIVLPNNESFIFTGDIDDLWIRDSAAQVHPYFQVMDDRIDRVIAGLIKRVAMYIRHDPYANAFRIDDRYVFSEAQKKMGRHDLVSTWNYELDSVCAMQYVLVLVCKCNGC
jgi:hypothetical protein